MRFRLRKHLSSGDPWIDLGGSDDLDEAGRLFKNYSQVLEPGGHLALFDMTEGRLLTSFEAPAASPKPVHLDSWQCASCAFEFVIVGLNRKTVEDTPYCPECGDSEDVHKIDCLDFALVEKVQEYVVEKRLRPLPGEGEAKP